MFRARKPIESTAKLKGHSHEKHVPDHRTVNTYLAETSVFKLFSTTEEADSLCFVKLPFPVCFFPFVSCVCLKICFLLLSTF